jgi:hypothetical protein
VTLGVDLALSPRRVRAVTADLDYQAAWEVGIDPSEGAGTAAEGLLKNRAVDSGVAHNTQEPALEPAFTATVHQRVEQRSAAVEATAMLADDTRA